MGSIPMMGLQLLVLMSHNSERIASRILLCDIERRRCE
jgi:hypothetical protein